MEADAEVVTSTALDEGIARFFGVSSAENDGISLADIRLKAASELSSYGACLMAEFAKIGVHIPPAVQLHCPEEGHVIVLGDNPAFQEITNLVNNDMFLLKRFKEVEVLHVLLRRAELRLAGHPMTCQHFNLGLTSLGCIAFFTEG